MTESEESSDFSYNENEDIFSYDVTRLWNKKDIFYKIDKPTGQEIIKNFELKISNPSLEVEDAFYSSMNVIPIKEINQFKDDMYIKERLKCKKLREMNFELLEITKKNILDIQKYIDLYRVSTDDDIKLILKSFIKQKKKLDILYNCVRNKIAEIIIKGEDCFIFMDSVWSTVFRKSLELATAEVSSQETC